MPSLSLRSLLNLLPTRREIVNAHVRWCTMILFSAGATAALSATYLIIRFIVGVGQISLYFAIVVLLLAILNVTAYYQCSRTGDQR
jgi:hypothetical protein